MHVFYILAQRKSLVAGASLILLVSLMGISWSDTPTPVPYHSKEDMEKMMNGTNLPVGDNTFFTGSGRCGGCHGDDPVDYANITQEGEDVSPATNWRATMMANSAKDPFWRAKIEHEILVNPSHAQELINKCTSCHAPVGKYTNLLLNGNPNYSLLELDNDSLARDGVNCGACHQQKMEGLGTHFSGELFYRRDTIYGPYVSEEQQTPIFEAAMQSFVGYLPLGNHKVSQSEFCAGCHSLETHTADLDGNLTGQKFIEQATYHEWLNSSYNDTPGLQQECQGCHMPRLQEDIVLASGYSFLPGRSNFGQHYLVGGNTFMLGMLKNNAATLGVTATEEHFNTVIQRTLYQLQNETALVTLTENGVQNDTAKYTVKLTNLAGHKFPSGYPSRRAYVEFIAVDDAGNEVFHSGKMNPDFTLANEDDVEPHYDLINSDQQVQIYEMIMADVNGNRTTVLERAADYLKDNRLTPLGFSTTSAVYDTTLIVGAASTDSNFNHYPNGQEGSGTDEIRFHIPLNGFSGNLHVTARFMYQTVPPKYLTEMFGFLENARIAAFKSMYDTEGAFPVQVGSQSLTTTIIGVAEQPIPWFLLYPNPTSDGWVTLSANGESMKELSIYTMNGQFVERVTVSSPISRIQLPDQSGVYLIEITTQSGKHQLQRIIRE